jgi:hypothetical protein
MIPNKKSCIVFSVEKKMGPRPRTMKRMPVRHSIEIRVAELVRLQKEFRSYLYSFGVASQMLPVAEGFSLVGDLVIWGGGATWKSAAVNSPSTLV